MGTPFSRMVSPSDQHFHGGSRLSVNLPTAALANVGLATLGSLHYALVRGTEHGSTRRGERNERERNGGVLRTLETRLKNANGVTAIDVGAVRALLCQSAAAGLGVLVVCEFPGVGVGTGHHEVDWPAALGCDLLHVGEGVQLVSRRTQSTDFGAYIGDPDFL